MIYIRSDIASPLHSTKHDTVFLRAPTVIRSARSLIIVRDVAPKLGSKKQHIINIHILQFQPLDTTVTTKRFTLIHHNSYEPYVTSIVILFFKNIKELTDVTTLLIYFNYCNFAFLGGHGCNNTTLYYNM